MDVGPKVREAGGKQHHSRYDGGYGCGLGGRDGGAEDDRRKRDGHGRIGVGDGRYHRDHTFVEGPVQENECREIHYAGCDEG